MDFRSIIRGNVSIINIDFKTITRGNDSITDMDFKTSIWENVIFINTGS